ncbi:Rrf2 family transcriptional regulator [Bacillus sp. CECT 9360]|uniref:Rrf2 family transcriptional regulator n=1 Tax=Bacillus sp. CECT 9360 TaxID=2845821 RepID=UPI001E5D89DD|nr:Rrf2 family transcriptional regulator [Bacillus sp. CECT 9360]CAH0347400.1 HTH-type transcriptional repressor NsrR [Bacillus sp. CECT 9360]
MRLTTYSDYSIRVLLYLATLEQGKLSNIKEIAFAYDISKNHLMKIIYNLGKMGYIETIRGRNGGIRLAKQPSEINIGEIVRKTEEDFYLVECFGNNHDNCVIAPVCSLKHVLNKALDTFLQVLDQYTLEDITHNKVLFREYFEAKQQANKEDSLTSEPFEKKTEW